MIPLDRVRAMVAAATPGPWVWRSDDADGCHVVEDPRARYEEEERLAETFRESTADIILMAAAPDLARDVLSLADALATAERERDSYRERDTARSALDGLAAAVRAEREASHARIAGELSGAAMVRARAALDALLRGAPCGYVPVPVVQRCLDAVDEWERERSAPVARTVARAAMVAARTALDAALAAATTTPKESP